MSAVYGARSYSMTLKRLYEEAQLFLAHVLISINEIVDMRSTVGYLQLVIYS